MLLAALMLTPILALFVMKGADFVAPVMAVPENYYNALSGGGFNWKSMSDILSGLGWGLGYFGMPHILVRYLSIKSEHEMRKSQIIGCSWIVLILAMSAVVGLIGRQFLGEIDNENLVFVHMVRRLFPAFISGVLLSAILAAAMMLRYSFDMAAEADCIESAVSAVLDGGYRTGDIFSPGCTQVGCREMGRLVTEHLKKG